MQSIPSTGQAKTKYQLYKAATSSVGKWLTSTALKFVDLEELDLYPTKLQGDQRDSYSLQICQYVPITDLIISIEPQVQVPAKIVKMAEMTWIARMERNLFMKGIDPESDQRHEHVISIFQEVYEKLYNHFHAHSTAKQKEKANLKPRQSKSQREQFISFELLELEDLDEEYSEDSDSTGETVTMTSSRTTASSSPKSNKKKKSKKCRDRQKAKVQALRSNKEWSDGIGEGEEEEDPYFVLMCLLSDMMLMRKYIKEIWAEYRQKKINLVTASLTTNAAFDIIRTYENDFPAIKPLLQNYTANLATIYSRNKEFKANTDTFSGRIKNPWHHIKVATTLAKHKEITDLTFAPVVYFLNYYQRHLLTPDGYDCQLGFLGKCHYDADTSKMSYAENIVVDFKLLASIACANYHYSFFLKGLTCDHFSLQWSTKSEKRDATITLSRAFGAQLYLDICHTLQGDIQRGYKDLLATSKRIMDDLALCSKITPNNIAQSTCSHKENEDHFTDFVESINEKAKYFYRHQEVWRHDTLNVFEDIDTLSPFEGNPLLCGITAFQLEMSIDLAGGQIGNRSNSIRAAGQLYYACQLHRDVYQGNKVLSERTSIIRGPPFSDDWTQGTLYWKEMECIFEHEGTAHHFYQESKPSSNYSLLMNHVCFPEHPLAYAYEDKHHPRCGCKHNYSSLDPPTWEEEEKGKRVVRGAIKERLYDAKYWITEDHKPDMNWTQDNLKALLRNHIREEHRKQTAWHQRQDGKDKYNVNKINFMESKSKSKNKLNDQVSLLRTLRMALQKEDQDEFCSMSFHIYCLKLLQHLRKEICKLIPELHDGKYFQLNKPAEVCNFARLAFQYMTIDEQKDRLWRMGTPPKMSSPMVTTIFIVQVDRIIREYLINKPFRKRKTWTEKVDLDMNLPIEECDSCRYTLELSLNLDSDCDCGNPFCTSLLLR